MLDNELDEDEVEPITFSNKVLGIWGEFTSGNSRVIFVSTTARFTIMAGDDEELVLTKYLTPVREILDPKTMKFSELLQRDLDDYRVVEEMVPYLLGMGAKGPVFFPPILAVLLPYQNRQAQDMPEVELSDSEGKRILSAGAVYQLKRNLRPDGELNRKLRRAELGWNETQAKLVVIDGQHRAMALLAIYRTQYDQWNNSNGREYQQYYERSVKTYLENKKSSDIEIPVTIALFPDLSGDKQVHQAARKLFIDVNKEAKSPSKSRLILMSDQDLRSVLTRELLEEIRKIDLENSSEAPLLTAIEYDNQTIKENETQIYRWSCFTNLTLLRDLVNYSIVKAPRYKKEMKILKYPKDTGVKVRLIDEYQHLIDHHPLPDGSNFNATDLDLEVTPPTVLNLIAQKYNETWGQLFIGAMKNTEPYKSHLEALHEVHAELLSHELDDKLVKQALFDGVGTFWTLQKFSFGTTQGGKDAVGLTSKKLDKVKAEFDRKFASKLIESDDENAVKNVVTLRDTTRTYAALMGLLMTFAHLFEWISNISVAPITQNETVELAKFIAHAINHGQTGRTDGGVYDRRLILSRGLENTPKFIMIDKLGIKSWVEFRCMWFELLSEMKDDFCAKVNVLMQFDGTQQEKLKNQLEISLTDSREHLLNQNLRERKRKAKNSGIALDDAELESQVLTEMSKAYKFWLKFDDEKFAKAFDAESTDGIWERHSDKTSPDDSEEENEDEDQDGED